MNPSSQISALSKFASMVVNGVTAKASRILKDQAVQKAGADLFAAMLAA